MSRLSKTLDKILRGSADANVDFNDLRNLLGALGFREHIRGSHHIFTDGLQGKSYQVRQVRQLIVKYGLGESDV
jgi:hypothetical protein